MAANDAHALPATLSELDEVVDEDVIAGERTVEHHVGGRCHVRRIRIQELCGLSS